MTNVAPKLTYEQFIERENARLAATAECMALLSLDEQYIMGYIIADFSRAKEADEKAPYEVTLHAAHFARRCLVTSEVAMERLKQAADSLFKRTLKFTYASKRGGKSVTARQSWFDAIGYGETSISLTLSLVATLDLDLALTVLKAEVEESESMVYDLFTKVQFVSAVLLRPISAAEDKEEAGATGRPPALVLWGHPAGS